MARIQLAQANIDRLLNDPNGMVQRELQRRAELVKQEVQRRVEEFEDTGDMGRSVTTNTTVSHGKRVVRIFFNVPYAKWVIDGTEGPYSGVPGPGSRLRSIWAVNKRIQVPRKLAAKISAVGTKGKGRDFLREALRAFGR